jgi:squalene-hopene/tetraprenyl-beta-curcumene cyclase
VLALDAVGFARDHPAIVSGLHGADDFLVDADGTLAMQPAIAPTRDTALAVRALLEAGVDPRHDALRRAADWLVAAQVFQPGDWAVLAPRLEPGGWSASPTDDAYPDVALSADVVLALGELPVAATPAGRRALAYGRNWTLGMQSRGGGWASFDVDNAVSLPLPGLEMPVDAPAADVTGRLLELMAATGYGLDFGRARAAVAFLRRSQRPDGSWPARWGVNAVCGTAGALAGLAAIGDDPAGPTMRAAVAWLVAHQNVDGGWGDSPRSYIDPTAGSVGDSTPTQTAWALLGLIAAGGEPGDAVERGIDWLLAAQRSDGTWSEHASTGTGIPGRLYLRRHLDRHVFPLLALARWRRRR